jgi:thiosulfate reductase cytochrome b subunit
MSLYDVYFIVSHLWMVELVSGIAFWGDELFLFGFASVLMDGFELGEGVVVHIH